MYEQDVRHPAIEILRRFALGALLAAVAATSAHAASFDCQAARSATEQAICASPKLSALDELMAQTYERAMHALSAEGAAQLKESQRSWLRFTRLSHARSARKENGTRGGASCPPSAWNTNTASAWTSSTRQRCASGPGCSTASTDTRPKLAPNDDELGEHPGVVTQHVAYPQIDAPRTPATIAWNKARVQSDLATPPTAEADAEAASATRTATTVSAAWATVSSASRRPAPSTCTARHTARTATK